MLKLENEYLTVKLDSKGGELISIKDRDKYEYMLRDKKVWNYTAPHLFPIVGTLNDGKLRYKNQDYDISRHGFIRNSELKLEYFTATECKYTYKFNSETLKSYPFKFKFEVLYTLDKNSIIITYNIINLDNKTIYYSLGTHPAFLTPIEDSIKFTDYYLELEKKETKEIHRVNLNNGLFKRKTIPFLKNEDTINLSKDLFDFDAVIFSNLKSKYISLKNRKNNKSVKVSFLDFPFLGIWSKPGNDAFVCIECWAGHSDFEDFKGDFRDKEDNECLLEGNSKNYSYKIDFN